MMTCKIVVTINHELEAELIRKWVAARLERLRRYYAQKIACCDISWSGDAATIKARALGYSVWRQFLTRNQVGIEASFPWILASLSGKIETLIMKNAKEAPGKI